MKSGESQHEVSSSKFYGPIIVAGTFFFLTINFSSILSNFPNYLQNELHSSIEGVATVTKIVAADQAEISISANIYLANSPKEVASKIATVSTAFATYLRTQENVTFTTDPISISSGTIEIKNKYAVEYSGNQKFYLKVSDISKLEDITRKAAELGVGSIGEVTYSLKDETLKQVKLDLVQEARVLAKKNAEESAKKQKLTLQKVDSANETAQLDTGAVVWNSGLDSDGVDRILANTDDTEEKTTPSDLRPNLHRAQINARASVTVRYQAK